MRKIDYGSVRNLWQHRTIRQEVSGRIFVPIQSSENGGILYVFPIFHTAGWGQKIRCSAKDDLFRGSLDLSGGMNMKAYT